jgi:restriction system protein
MTALPSWEGFNVLVLKALAEGGTLSLRELCNRVADLAELTAEQRVSTLSSGQSRAFNRISWAASYLNRVDALRRPHRGLYQITDVGRKLLASHPDDIGEKDLRLIAKPDDRWWEKKTTDTLSEIIPAQPEVTADESVLDPIEQVDQGVARINDEVAVNLINRLQEGEPAFFEQVVVDLLIAMGYGGVHGRGMVTQLNNDNGIDGIIDQDALGLNKVYVQAKRYSSSNKVNRPEVQGFVGALSGKAEGGLFITTGKFSDGAIDYARKVPTRIILIDGQQLVTLMIKYKVGVQVKQSYEIVEIDEDFFA